MLEYSDHVRLTMAEDNDSPFRKGPNRPTSKQWTADYGDLKVIGEIPRDLTGIFARNGHNQIYEPLGL